MLYHGQLIFVQSCGMKCPPDREALRSTRPDGHYYSERAIDCKAGYKHHLTKDYLRHLQGSLMDICQREGLYQVDLLSPAADKITQQEYHAKRRGQLNLDMANIEIIVAQMPLCKTDQLLIVLA